MNFILWSLGAIALAWFIYVLIFAYVGAAYHKARMMRKPDLRSAYGDRDETLSWHDTVSLFALYVSSPIIAGRLLWLFVHWLYERLF